MEGDGGDSFMGVLTLILTAILMVIFFAYALRYL